MQKEQGKNKTKYESLPESMLSNDGALDTVIWIEQKESWGGEVYNAISEQSAFVVTGFPQSFALKS